MVSIIQFLNWTYVAVVKESGSYGERLTDDFKSKLKNKSKLFVRCRAARPNECDLFEAVCIAGELSVNNKDLTSYVRVIRELYEDEKYRSVVGVVVFAQEDSVR